MMTTRTFLQRLPIALAAPAAFSGCSSLGPIEPLWTPRALTQPGEFTPGIEGPCCDRDGNIYAVNFARQQTIGKTTPDGRSEIFLTLPGKSTGNGIVFDRAGTMFIADYAEHNVLRVDMKTKQISVFAHQPQMNQPNDLAIAADGTLFASDPNWKEGTGQLWRIDRDGKTTRLAAGMGTTNGIEVSPDGKHLYVNESVQRNLWAFDIAPDKSLTNKRLLRKFDDHGFDGHRCDVDGNLYITRYGEGVVAVVSPKGEILRKVPVLGARPSNLCFGGPDGRTAYVTEVEHTRLVTFRTERPGLAWSRWQGSK
jgi:gluconolactonase